MALKIKRTGSEEFGRWIKLLVCGDPGAGKTLQASSWPNPLYVNAEGGLLSLQDKDLATVDVTDTGVLLELKNVLSQSPAIRERELGTPVDTVVLDTFDEIARIFIKERMESTGKDSLAIGDWGWLGEQLRAVVRNYRNLPINVILNCHLRSQTDEETGKMFIKPAIQGAMGDELPGYVDLAVVLTAKPQTEIVNGRNVKKIVRAMQTFPDTRSPWIKDRSGKLPMEFPVNFVDDYARLHGLIFSDRPAQAQIQEVDAPVQKESLVSVATPEAIPEVEPEPKKKAAPRKKAAPVPPSPEPVAESLPVESVPEVMPDPVPEPEPTPEPEVEESVPASETVEEVDVSMTCADCGGPIETKDQADLSFIRFRRRLDKKCFKEARARK